MIAIVYTYLHIHTQTEYYQLYTGFFFNNVLDNTTTWRYFYFFWSLTKIK